MRVLVRSTFFDTLSIFQVLAFLCSINHDLFRSLRDPIKLESVTGPDGFADDHQSETTIVFSHPLVFPSMISLSFKPNE